MGLRVAVACAGSLEGRTFTEGELTSIDGASESNLFG